MLKITKDKYKSSRGGDSRLLAISCAKCQTFVCRYQKDGPGTLRRMYFDRITDMAAWSDELLCPHCQAHLGSKTVYAKENRLAYRLITGAIGKKILK